MSIHRNYLQLAEAFCLLSYIYLRYGHELLPSSYGLTGASDFDDESSALVSHLASFASFFGVLRLISFSRSNHHLGSLVRMVVQVFIDLGPFMVFQAIVMLAYALAYYILSRDAVIGNGRVT